jgi:hypothetical protein
VAVTRRDRRRVCNQPRCRVDLGSCNIIAASTTMSANVPVERVGKGDVFALITEDDRIQTATRYINAALCETDLGKTILEDRSMCKYVRSGRKSL